MKILLAFSVFCACAAPLDDLGPYAVDAGDTTALLSGCGDVVAVGHLYCRFADGWEPTGHIVVSFPPVTCGAETCGSVVVFGPDGSRIIDRPIGPNATTMVIHWVELVGTAPLTKLSRGFWPVVVRWRWLNGDGMPEETIQEGEIRLRVYSQGYRPLGAGDDSRWRWHEGPIVFSVTTKGRAWASAKRWP